MKHLNIDLIRVKATDIGRAKRILDRYAEMTEDEFLRDDSVVSAAKYQLIVIAGAAESICNNIATQACGWAPEGENGYYQVQGITGAFQPIMLRRLRAISCFRDLLIHRYDEVNDGEVYSLVVSVRADLDKFLIGLSHFVGISI